MKETSEQEIFNNFLAEATETLQSLEKDLLRLEQSPDDREIIDNIFRGMHSLKGNCSLFGITGIKMMAHCLESLMSRVRDKEMEMNTEITNIVLRGMDHLKSMFAILQRTLKEEQLTPKQEEYITELNSLLESGGEERVNENLRIELLKFLNRQEIKEHLETDEPMREMLGVIRRTAPKLLADRRTNVGDPLMLDGLDVSREYYSVLGILADVETGKSSENYSAIVFGELESLLSRHGEQGQNEPMELLQNLRDDLEMLYHDETGFDDILAQITQEAWLKYRAMLWQIKPEPAGKPAGYPQNGAGTEPAEHIRGRQIKVDQGALDKTIDMAGELVTISEFFNYLQTQFAEGDKARTMNSLKDAISSLQELSESLSRDLYEIRKVPIGEAFQNLPRMVRDMQIALGKRVRLVIEGEDTAVDKSFVAKIETVLVHMIRNSIDHGLELPEERRQAGKDEEGTIRLVSAPQGGMLAVAVEDDGRGIDPAKIRRILVAKGIMSHAEAEALPEKELLMQIFAPGFSSAEQVTETSGRGVGMDVVLSTVQDIGGSIKLENQPGKGLTVRMTIPFTHTTLIQKGLAVGVGKTVFLIPVESVLESFRPNKQDIYSIEKNAEVINRRGEIVRLVRLHRLLGIKGKSENPEDGILVMVQRKKAKACFLVDYVIGQRQIIYKPLGVRTLRHPSPFEGVSVYDGSRLAMILDIQGIVEQSSK